MSNQTQPATPVGEFLLYQTEDGRTRIQCRFENEILWLTQAQIAELFQTTPQNVTLHLKAVYAEGELSEAATCKDYLQVRQEGACDVSRNLRHYRLEAVLAVGYRVRGHRGTQFRQWATARLSEYPPFNPAYFSLSLWSELARHGVTFFDISGCARD